MWLSRRHFHTFLSKANRKEAFEQNHSNGKITLRRETTWPEVEILVYPSSETI